MKAFIIILKGHEPSEAFGRVAMRSGKQFGWDVVDFDAIDGRKTSFADHGLKVTTISKKAQRTLDRPGQRGASLSHYTLWKKCIELNEPIGIFEQDVIFQKPWNNNTNFQDLLRLDILQEGKDHGTGRWWQGAHAYIVKPEGAKKMVEWFHNYGAWPCDWSFGTKVVDVKFDSTDLITLDHSSKEHSLTEATSF